MFRGTLPDVMLRRAIPRLPSDQPPVPAAAQAHRHRWPLLAVLAVTACGSPSYPGVTPIETPTAPITPSSASAAAQQPTGRACTTLLRAGVHVPLGPGKAVSCTTPDGETLTLVQVVCTDGVHRLSQVQPGQGVPPGWVSAPGVYHVTSGRPDQDPGYLAAEQKCMT